MSKPVIAGVRTGRKRRTARKTTMSAAHVQRIHAEWKARLEQDRLAHKGIGKKATHAKKPVIKPLTEREG